jgi:hypothetical protein
MASGIALEQSHGKPRLTVRVDEVPPIAPSESTPVHTPGTTRFGKGNQAWRLRQLKDRADGLSTLNPARCPSWMRPHVEQGASYIVALLGMLEKKPALHPLAGDVADAHAMYRAMVTLALAAEHVKDRMAMLSEARGWLREHRTSLATLSALAGDMKLPTPEDATPWLTTSDAPGDKGAAT